jgi:cytoskeletal protein CcmA (bactofilin family)
MTTTMPNPTSSELGSAQPATTLLGKGSEFEGKLSFEGTVRVDGKLTGEIFTDDVLIVGEGAEVNAEVTIEIHSPGRVKGNINTPSLFIEKGVVFDGQCQMDASGAADMPPPRHGKKSASSVPSSSPGSNGGNSNSSSST